MNPIFLIPAAAVLIFLLSRKAEAEKAQGFYDKTKYAKKLDRYQKYIDKAHAKWGVPEKYIKAIILTESSGDSNAVGSSGEIGLMQVSQPALDDLKIAYPSIFHSWRLGNLFDPEKAIYAGTAFLKLQLNRSHNWPDAVRAYNVGYAGMRRNKNAGLAYLNRVKKFYNYV